MKKSIQTRSYGIYGILFTAVILLIAIAINLLFSLLPDSVKKIDLSTEKLSEVSEEAKKHIFDKFYQGDSSHKDNGNGLGLALVKKILSVANGEITVENLSPKGCRFTVNLPL